MTGLAESAGHIVWLSCCPEVVGVMVPRIFVLAVLFLFSLSGCSPEGTPSTPSEPADKAAAPPAPAPSSFDLRPGDPALKLPVGTQNADGIASTGKEGALVVGPSAPIAAGKYVARFYGAWGKPAGSKPAVFDVYWDGSGPYPSTNPKPGQMLSATDNLLAEVPFDVPAQAPNFQARVWVSPEHKLTISRIEVRSR